MSSTLRFAPVFRCTVSAVDEYGAVDMVRFYARQRTLRPRIDFFLCAACRAHVFAPVFALLGSLCFMPGMMRIAGMGRARQRYKDCVLLWGVFLFPLFLFLLLLVRPSLLAALPSLT